MPYPCFSYPAGSKGRDVAWPNLRDPRMMPNACFSYAADKPRSMPVWACFSYQAEVPRRTPIGSCFSYPGAVPPEIRNRDTARPGPDGHVTGACVSYPVLPCFRY
jgi:hypothetical protein